MSIRDRAPVQLLSLAVAAAFVLLAGCQKQAPVQTNYQMGEKIFAGPLTYNVVQTSWRTQLGELFSIRMPQDRFFLVTLSVANGGNRDVSVPFFVLEGDKGKEYREVQDGTAVDNWFGLIRTIQPGETRQGNLLFDVPLTSYRLRLTDGGETGTEKYVWVDIPLHLDTDTSLAVPAPGVVR